MTDRLNHCPFCGEEAKLLISRSSEGKVQYRIRCHNIDCDVRPSTSWFVCKEEVIERWNRRKPMDRIENKLIDAAESGITFRKSGVTRTAMFVEIVDAIKIIEGEL